MTPELDSVYSAHIGRGDEGAGECGRATNVQRRSNMSNAH